MPADTKREAERIRKPRKEFRARVIKAVLQSNHHLYQNKKKPQQKKMAFDHLTNQNGIQRNGQTYIELPCTISAYPYRDEYMTSSLSEKDIKDHVTLGGGINGLLSYYQQPPPALLKWSELHAV